MTKKYKIRQIPKFAGSVWCLIEHDAFRPNIVSLHDKNQKDVLVVLASDMEQLLWRIHREIETHSQYTGSRMTAHLTEVGLLPENRRTSK